MYLTTFTIKHRNWHNLYIIVCPISGIESAATSKLTGWATKFQVKKTPRSAWDFFLESAQKFWAFFLAAVGEQETIWQKNEFQTTNHFPFLSMQEKSGILMLRLISLQYHLSWVWSLFESTSMFKCDSRLKFDILQKKISKILWWHPPWRLFSPSRGAGILQARNKWPGRLAGLQSCHILARGVFYGLGTWGN